MSPEGNLFTRHRLTRVAGQVKSRKLQRASSLHSAWKVDATFAEHLTEELSRPNGLTSRHGHFTTSPPWIHRLVHPVAFVDTLHTNTQFRYQSPNVACSSQVGLGVSHNCRDFGPVPLHSENEVCHSEPQRSGGKESSCSLGGARFFPSTLLRTGVAALLRMTRCWRFRVPSLCIHT